MDIKDRLKLIRGNQRQDEFATRIGVHKNTVGRWERGEQEPNYGDMNRILHALPDINPAWLLAEEGPVKRGTVPAPSALLDDNLLIAVMEAVEEHLDQVKGRLTPAKKAQLVATLYEMCMGDKKVVDKATVIRLVKLAA